MPLDPARERLIALGLRDCHDPTSITYGEVRPTPVGDYKARRFPIVTDCSGWYQCLCYAAGLPDPMGTAYAGAGHGGCEGYTGTLLSYLATTTKAACFPGDCVVFGAYPGVHVAVFLQRGSAPDPLMGSNGQPADPVEIHLSDLIAAFPGRAVTYLRLPEKDEANLSWQVRDMRGRLLGTTNHPAVWAARHSGSFRSHGEVSFHKEVS